MAKKKTASKPTNKKAAAKPAVAPVTAPPPPSSNGKLTWATIIHDKLIVQFDNDKEFALHLTDVHPLHKHFGDKLDVTNNTLTIPIHAHLLKIPGSKLLELIQPVTLDGLEAAIQNFDAIYKIMSNFGKWLTEKLEQKKMQQQELADRIDVHFSEISKYCKDTKKPNSVRLFQIMAQLGVDPRKL